MAVVKTTIEYIIYRKYYVTLQKTLNTKDYVSGLRIVILNKFGSSKNKYLLAA